MKNRLLFTIVLMLTTLLSTAQKVNFTKEPMTLGQNDKLVLMMVHFGTTHSDTRTQTIDAINTLAAKNYPNAKVVEAYTSRIVIRRLAANGVVKLTPHQMLEELLKEGYTHVLVQSTHIIDGIEMESLRRECESMTKHFKEIRIGNPLLYHPADYETVIDALQQQMGNNKNSVVLVGHGTYTPITASYAMLDYMLKAKGLKDWHVGTVEGFPAFEDVVEQLRKGDKKSVTLLPFMFVAGEHAKKDIAGEWKEELEKLGYSVQVDIRGLGQNSMIQQLYIDHIEYARQNKHLDIMDKKRKYSQEKD